ncbi:chymotrypsin-elastase inhibitor ixodidin-like [Anopheles stephensi]|uniref:chymotrypsin-elastase inhibitor ixodidin-like n=1 Tax=Anopheles stephensi TaxID=30069 RepID=UPI0007D4ACEA|nr:chymotrypsin-elastase inhibitor ixodidin-like [Anopheles stephensi]
MKLICVCLLVFSFGLLVADGSDVCRYGERWRCFSSECEKTCSTLNTNTECTATCTNGCYCAAGFVRTAFGSCSPRYVCRYKSSFRF